MAICIASYKVIPVSAGKAPIDKKILQTYDNYHDFGFDIYDHENWRSFLRKYTIDGKLLPRKDSNGFRIAYHVYFFGMPKDFPKHAPQGSYYNLFPGYKDDGIKRRVIDEGYLD